VHEPPAALQAPTLHRASGGAAGAHPQGPAPHPHGPAPSLRRRCRRPPCARTLVHAGARNYTLGRRPGLGLAWGWPITCNSTKRHTAVLLHCAMLEISRPIAPQGPASIGMPCARNTPCAHSAHWHCRTPAPRTPTAPNLAVPADTPARLKGLANPTSRAFLENRTANAF